MPSAIKKSFLKKNKRVITTFGILAALIVGLGSVTVLTMQGQDNRGWAAGGMTNTTGQPNGGTTGGTTNTTKPPSAGGTTNTTTPPTGGTNSGAKQNAIGNYPGAKAGAATTTPAQKVATGTTNSGSGSSGSGSSGGGSGSTAKTVTSTNPVMSVNGCVKGGNPTVANFLTITWTSAAHIKSVNVSTDTGMPAGANRWDAAQTNSKGYFWYSGDLSSSQTSFNVPSGLKGGWGYALNKTLPVAPGKYYAYAWDGTKSVAINNVDLKNCP